MNAAIARSDTDDVAKAVPVRSHCLHCALPLPSGTAGDFCCRGCEVVSALLEGEDLNLFYQLRQGSGARVVDIPNPTRELDWIEDSLVESQVAEQRHFRFDIQGIHCAGCVWILENTFRHQLGALKILVNPVLGKFEMWVSDEFPIKEWIRSTERFGYRLGPALKTRRRASDALLLRLGVCIAIAINVMLLSVAVYLGLEEGRLYELFRNASYALASVSVLVGAPVFLRSAIEGLRNGVLHLDLPISTGIILAFSGSSWAFWTGRDNALYLDSVSVFIALMLFGRYLQERILEANRNRLLESQGSEGLRSRRLVNGRPQTIKTTTILRGDSLLIPPGDLIPVDAQLVSPHARVSMDWINGESRSQRCTAGHTLQAGSFNAGDNAFEVRAIGDFSESPLEQLLRPSGATDIGAHESGLIRLISGHYVVGVLVAAVLGFAAWFVLVDAQLRGLEVAIAVLVVTCPCAFGIATPLAHELVQSRLRREGLYVRAGDFLERASLVSDVVFDKTGTLTTGRMTLTNPEVLDTLSVDARQILNDLSARSSHPTSMAIAESLAPYNLSLRTEVVTQELAGKGVRCRLDSGEYCLGEAAWAANRHNTADTVFTLNGQVLAQFTIQEELRLDAIREVRALRNEGYGVHILSGDSREPVQRLARELGVPGVHAHADVSPENKRQWLADRGDKNMLFLGDGINDSLAAQQASCSGTPALDRPYMASHCDFYLGTDQLGPIRSALHAAKQLATVIRRNLVFALAYNILAIGLAWSGLMRPWLAAILMPTSSILIVAATVISLTPTAKPGQQWKS